MTLSVRAERDRGCINSHLYIGSHFGRQACWIGLGISETEADFISSYGLVKQPTHMSLMVHILYDSYTSDQLHMTRYNRDSSPDRLLTPISGYVLGKHQHTCLLCFLDPSLPLRASLPHIYLRQRPPAYRGGLSQTVED